MNFVPAWIHESSSGLISPESTRAEQNLQSWLRNPPAPSHAKFPIIRAEGARAPIVGAVNTDKRFEERLFDVLGEAKIKTAQVAMHLPSQWRKSIFAQLDELHDHEGWDPDDQLTDLSTYTTFLRLILFVKPKQRAGLGLSSSGHVIAAWTKGADELTIECLPKDQIVWIVSVLVDGSREHAAGNTTLQRMLRVLEPYGPAKWFAD
ncbi:MAG: hypothetical protein NVS2B5_27890 [Beijerinckiaceae bacterium]